MSECEHEYNINVLPCLKCGVVKLTPRTNEMDAADKQDEMTQKFRDQLKIGFDAAATLTANKAKEQTGDEVCPCTSWSEDGEGKMKCRDCGKEWDGSARPVVVTRFLAGFQQPTPKPTGFIKLTRSAVNGRNHAGLLYRLDDLDHFERGENSTFTEVFFRRPDGHNAQQEYVLETPEEILRLIEEAQ